MKSAALGIVVLLICGGACCAQLSVKTAVALEAAVALADNQLELRINNECGNTYYEGQEILISVTSPVGGYLYIFYFQADGAVTMMLFPCRNWWRDFPLTIEASTKVVLPREKTKLHVSAPFGREVMFAIVVPEEQMDLVQYFDAYSYERYSYRTEDQEGFAISLVTRAASLKSSGAGFSAGTCVFFTAKTAPTPTAPSSSKNDDGEKP